MCLFTTDTNRRPVLTRGTLRAPGKMFCLPVYNMGFVCIFFLSFFVCCETFSTFSLPA